MLLVLILLFRFSLTDEGVTLALRIKKAETTPPNSLDISDHSLQNISSPSISPTRTSIPLPSSSYPSTHATMQPSNDNHSQPSINNESVTACPTNNDPIYISDIDSSPSSSTGRVGIKTCQAKDKMSSFKYNNDLYIIDSDDDESDSDLPSVGHLFGTKSHSNNNYESPATNEHCNEDLLPSPLLAYNNTSIINTSQSNEVSPKLTSKQLVPSPQLQPTNTSISCIGTCPSNEVTVINSDSDSDSDILPLAERIGISVVSSDNSKKIYPHKPVGVNSTCKPVTRPSNQPSVTIPANTITNNTLLHIPTSASSQKEATTRLEQPLVLSITTHTTTATKSVAGRSSQKDPIELSLQKSLVTLRPGIDGRFSLPMAVIIGFVFLQVNLK